MRTTLTSREQKVGGVATPNSAHQLPTVNAVCSARQGYLELDMDLNCICYLISCLLLLLAGGDAVFGPRHGHSVSPRVADSFRAPVPRARGRRVDWANYGGAGARCLASAASRAPANFSIFNGKLSVWEFQLILGLCYIALSIVYDYAPSDCLHTQCGKS